VRTDLILKGIHTASQSFQGGQRLILFQIGLSCYAEDTDVSIKENPHVLQVEVSSTLLPERIE
jgi:hypothetical protein